MHEGECGGGERYREIAEENGELYRIREHDSGEHKSGKRAWDEYAFSEEDPEGGGDGHDGEAGKGGNVGKAGKGKRLAGSRSAKSPPLLETKKNGYGSPPFSSACVKQFSAIKTLPYMVVFY